MDRDKISKSQVIFIAAAVLIVAAVVVIALTTSKAPDVKGTPGGSSTASTGPAETGGQVAKTRVTGLQGGTYFGQTIKFAVPPGVQGIQDVGSGDFNDQLIFTFAGGNGTLSSQPNDASMNFDELKNLYPGKKKKLEIAGADGFILDQSTQDIDSVTAIAYRGPLMLTIQLTGTGDQGQLDKLAQELGSVITVRKAAGSTSEAGE
jgi:hypothetical protein